MPQILVLLDTPDAVANMLVELDVPQDVEVGEPISFQVTGVVRAILP